MLRHSRPVGRALKFPNAGRASVPVTADQLYQPGGDFSLPDRSERAEALRRRMGLEIVPYPIVVGGTLAMTIIKLQ